MYNADRGCGSDCYKVPCPEVISILNVSEIVAGFQGLNIEDCTRIIDYTPLPSNMLLRGNNILTQAGMHILQCWDPKLSNDVAVKSVSAPTIFAESFL